MTARHGCGQGLLRCNGTYRGDGNGYPLLFCCATGHQVCCVWHPQSPSLAEEAFAGSINGDCEYLQMQGHFRRISAPCMLKIRRYGFLSNPQKKTRLKLARRLTRTKAPMPSDGTLTARELMLRFTGIDICRCRQCGGNLASYNIRASPKGYNPIHLSLCPAKRPVLSGGQGDFARIWIAHDIQGVDTTPFSGSILCI